MFSTSDDNIFTICTLGGMVYVSGCIALDAATMTLVDGDVAIQTRKVLENMQAIVEAAGSSLNNVVKCTGNIRHLTSATSAACMFLITFYSLLFLVLLCDMADFAAVNSVYSG